MLSDDEVARLAEALRGPCGHSAQALAPVVEEIARARVEGALRETADAWTQGEWSNVLLPKPTPPAVPVIAYANRVGWWLQARAPHAPVDGAQGGAGATGEGSEGPSAPEGGERL